MLSPYLEKLNSKKIMLASSSAARQKIISQSGLEFTISPSNFSEDLDKSQYTHEEYVTETSYHKLLDKIEDLKSKQEHADIIIVGDTVISYDGDIIEKAENAEHAISICKRLTGQTHTVMTSVFIAFLDQDLNITGKKHILDKTEVEFYTLTDRMIEDYVETGNAYGKSG